MEDTKFIIMSLLLLLAYLFPSIIANSRKHKDYNAIVFLNLILGWTIIIYIVCFVWSLTGNVEKK